MTDESAGTSAINWLKAHPLVTTLVLTPVALLAWVGIAAYLDYRVEQRDAQVTRSGRPPGEPTGAVPSELPHEIVRGQTVYVPLYSHVFEGDGRRLALAGTLSIRNTDSRRKLTISNVTYYDTKGKLVRNFLAEPLTLNPLGSTDFFVGQSDVTGGAGANFLVEWLADEPVHSPVIEAVMVGRSGVGIVSFVCSGHVIEQVERNDEPPAE
ncbi:MAG: DUF3124 domain-containing protein [Planctomycetota bacterium]|nr:MAG: DUF3124 domain-containing protein [Planctomycetota bacterium]